MESIISRFTEHFKLWDWSILTGFVSKFFLGFAVICLIIGAFLLGRISKFMEQSPVFSYESQVHEDQAFQKEKESFFGRAITSTSTIVASSGGKKYYFVWCKGAANIKESKKRYFETEDEAKNAGYTLAANCK